MSHSEKNSRLFYPDFIRVIAFLCILLFHFQVETSHFAVFRGIPAISSGICEIDLGQLGVSLFFILSGASLMISKKPFDAVSFYKKRFFTLFPAYYLVWGGAFLGTLLLSPESLDGTPPWTILLTILGLDGYVYSICPNFYKVGEWFFGCLLLISVLSAASDRHGKTSENFSSDCPFDLDSAHAVCPNGSPSGSYFLSSDSGIFDRYVFYEILEPENLFSGADWCFDIFLFPFSVASA